MEQAAYILSRYNRGDYYYDGMIDEIETVLLGPVGADINTLREEWRKTFALKTYKYRGEIKTKLGPPTVETIDFKDWLIQRGFVEVPSEEVDAHG